MSGSVFMLNCSTDNIKHIVTRLAAGRPLTLEQALDATNNPFQDKESYRNVIEVLNQEREFDEYTCSHSLNVAFYSMLIGNWLKMTEKELQDIVISGLLHDVGKTKVPLPILNKKTRLLKEEFDEIKNHCYYGYKMVKKMKSLPEEICQVVLQHHERMDGSGYPAGLVGDQISLYSRIIAVADVYDALTSERVYKRRTTPFEAFAILKNTDCSNLDPEVVDVFLKNISLCFVGAKVALNTGGMGRIMDVSSSHLFEPVVLAGSREIDLTVERESYIVSML